MKERQEQHDHGRSQPPQTIRRLALRPGQQMNSPRPTQSWKAPAKLLLALLLLALPTNVKAQFSWTTNAGAISITGYSGLGGTVTIPDTVTGLPVTSTLL